jgi:hypothetical protein
LLLSGDLAGAADTGGELHFLSDVPVGAGALLSFAAFRLMA